MRVTGLPRDPGPAAWNRLLPAPPPPTPLSGDRKSDWLVIGAGFAGLAAARRLSQIREGDTIAILDAVRVGDGPAGRNSGFMIDLPHDLSSDNYGGDQQQDQAQIEAKRAAIAFARDAAQEYGLPSEPITLSGKINAAASSRGMRHNADYAAHLASLGEAHAMYDAAQMQAITGSDYYQGGLFTPGAAMIQPAMFVRGMAQGLQSNRITLHENSPVTGLTRSQGVWTASTPAGSVAAPNVVLAVNGHAESFGFFRRRLMHVFTYASMTRALSGDEIAALGGIAVWGATPADPLGTTVRRISGIGGDRIVIRNRFTYDPGMTVNERRIASVGRDHDKAFQARFPVLKGVAMEYRWGGRLCLSRNNVPAFGEVEDSLFAACCQNGLGTAKGTFAGIAAADLAAGEDTLFTRHQLAAAPPARLPPEPLAWIGANARMRWGERAAGKEM
ncbi:MAG: FAD-binding oxidoreductase [Minwuia sp.]|nr:FAD-binding oxidoreductase [Minwuia sp.]